MHNAGIDALVELTPIGLGRDPRGIVKIAELSGLQIVLTTGIHQQAHYSPEHWIYRIGTDKLAGLFIRDINEGCDGADYGGPSEHQLPFAPASSRSVPGTGGLRRWNVACLGQRARRTGKLAHQSSVTWKWAAQPGKCWIF